MPPELIKGLKEDIDEYRETNTMKSMKRFYSLLIALGKEKNKQRQLVSYFNSPIGYVNKIKNDLELLMDLTDKHEIKWEIIQSNIQKCTSATKAMVKYHQRPKFSYDRI